MPWTFAHPAVVLALHRVSPKHFSFTALVVGSIAPDFGYYIGRFDVATFAHTLLGIFFVCIPTGLVSMAIISLLGSRICFLLPQPHRGAISTYPSIHIFKSFPSAFLILALVLGAMTHVVWDGFTHPGGWVVIRVPFLWQPISIMGMVSIPLYKLLQHLSSLLGVVILVSTYIAWLHRHSASPLLVVAHQERRRFVLLGVLLLLSLAIAVGMALAQGRILHGHVEFGTYVFRIAIIGTSVFIALVAVVAIFIYDKPSDDRTFYR